MSGRPRPAIGPDNEFFWEGVERGELLFQRCANCGRFRHPARPMCPHCHSLEWEAVPSTGRGSVFSFTVAHHPPMEGFEVPYVVVLVDLEEGVRLIADLVGDDATDVYVGMPVEVTFVEAEDHEGSFMVPAFACSRDVEDATQRPGAPAAT